MFPVAGQGRRNRLQSRGKTAQPLTIAVEGGPGGQRPWRRAERPSYDAKRSGASSASASGVTGELIRRGSGAGVGHLKSHPEHQVGLLGSGGVP